MSKTNSFVTVNQILSLKTANILGLAMIVAYIHAAPNSLQSTDPISGDSISPIDTSQKSTLPAQPISADNHDHPSLKAVPALPASSATQPSSDKQAQPNPGVVSEHPAPSATIPEQHSSIAPSVATPALPASSATQPSSDRLAQPNPVVSEHPAPSAIPEQHSTVTPTLASSSAPTQPVPVKSILDPSKSPLTPAAANTNTDQPINTNQTPTTKKRSWYRRRNNSSTTTTTTPATNSETSSTTSSSSTKKN